MEWQMLIPHELHSNTSRIHTEKRPQNRPKYHPLQSQIRHHTHTRHASTIQATRSHESDRLRKCLHSTEIALKQAKTAYQRIFVRFFCAYSEPWKRKVRNGVTRARIYARNRAIYETSVVSYKCPINDTPLRGGILTVKPLFERYTKPYFSFCKKIALEWRMEWQMEWQKLKKKYSLQRYVWYTFVASRGV